MQSMCVHVLQFPVRFNPTISSHLSHNQIELAMNDLSKVQQEFNVHCPDKSCTDVKNVANKLNFQPFQNLYALGFVDNLPDMGNVHPNVGPRRSRGSKKDKVYQSFLQVFLTNNYFHLIMMDVIAKVFGDKESISTDVRHAFEVVMTGRHPSWHKIQHHLKINDQDAMFDTYKDLYHEIHHQYYKDFGS